MRPLNVFVDVDDTLVRTAGTKRIPMPAVIGHIRRLYEEGAVLYCWSSGGADYARRSAEELGIAECFQGFLPKPDVLIDDQSMNQWRLLRCLSPSECGDLTVEGS